jgi:hypothetical protein
MFGWWAGTGVDIPSVGVDEAEAISSGARDGISPVEKVGVKVIPILSKTASMDITLPL